MVFKRWGLAVTLVLGSSAQAADEAAVIRDATKILEEIASNPESGIPPQVLKEATGIAVVPHMVETQVGLGRKKGHGVYLPRNEKGEWGGPERFEISAVSVGPEVGREVTDIVMVYRTKKAADGHANHALAMSLSVKARHTLKAVETFNGPTDTTKKQVATFTRRRGIMVGAKFTGEHRWGAVLAPAESKASAAHASRPSLFGSADKTTLDANSPEVVRLRTILAAMAGRFDKTAEAGQRDPNVSQASGMTASPEKSDPPRTGGPLRTERPEASAGP